MDSDVHHMYILNFQKNTRSISAGLVKYCFPRRLENKRDNDLHFRIAPKSLSKQICEFCTHSSHNSFNSYVKIWGLVRSLEWDFRGSINP